MKQNIINLSFGIFIAIIIFSLIWYINLISSLGLSGVIGGIVGGGLCGVLITTYISKYQDERFTQIMNLSARNLSVFLVFALPLSVVIMVFGSLSVIQAAMLVFALWLASLGINYVSLLYYYKH